VDNITGTAGNDTIVADNTAGAGKYQLTAADQINSGAGTDTMKIYNLSIDTVGASGFGTLSNVENLYLNNGTLTDSATLDVSTVTGVTSVAVDSPVAMVNGKSFTIKTTATQAVSLTNVSGAGAATTGKINLNGATDVTLNKVGTDGSTFTLDLTSTGTALKLTSTGAESTVTLANTGAKLATLTIAGDKGLTLTESINGLKTIDASAATAAVNVDASGATIDKTFAFTGGAGNDTLTLKAGALGLLTAGSQLDGGAGTGDTLVTNETAALTAAQFAAINAAKNFEVLGFGADGSGADVSKLTSINQFKVGAANISETFTNASSTSKFVIDNSSGNRGTVTITNKVGENATSINVDTGTAGASKTLAKIDVTGITSVALSSTGVTTKAGDANVITTLANADNSSIVVTGDTDLTITNALAATNIGSKVDASAFTGKLSVIGSTKADVLIGGTGNDTLQGAVADTASAADTLTGGAGADNFVFAGSNMAKLLTTSGGKTAVTKITDFVAGTDKIKFVDGDTAETSMTLASAQTIATAADLTAVYAGITAIAASTDNGAMSGVVVTVTAGAAAGTYLYVNDGTAAVDSTKDMLINITGISGTLTANDFAFA
jgi:hypothetical protein